MKVLLLGLGRANQSVAKYVIERGDEVYLYEDNFDTLSKSAQRLLKTNKIKMYRKSEYDLVITSPGFPQSKEIVQEIRSKNISIIDEIEFTYRQLKEPKIIAITGTNGKSTTASIISNILSAAGINNFLGGNIAPGRPFSQALFESEFEYYVLETSSFQLVRIEEFHPIIAVFTNISLDHLNWHSNFDEYKQAKLRIFENQNQHDFAILNYEDDAVRGFAGGIKAQTVFFGFNAKTGAYLNGNFYFKDEKLFPVEKYTLLGRHNLMNGLAAVAVAKILGIPNTNLENGLITFKTLPHRLEDIGIIGGIRYINNSMCTNENAAIASFRAVQGSKIVIVGGKQKGDKGDKYLDILTKEADACVILGENASYIVSYFKAHDFKRFAVADDMEDAIRKARAFAHPGDTILFNPGFASFDYFANFEERGEVFKNAAHRG